MSTNGNGVINTYEPISPYPITKKAVSAVKIGVVGYGYWGTTVGRHLQAMTGAEIVAVCDESAASRRRAHKNNPSIYVTADVSEVTTSPEVDAVAVVTPVWTHLDRK